MTKIGNDTKKAFDKLKKQDYSVGEKKNKEE